MEGIRQSQPLPDEERPKIIKTEKISEMSPEYQGDKYGIEYFQTNNAADDCFGVSLLNQVNHIKERTLPVERRLQKFGFSSPALLESQREVEERRTLSPEAADALVHKVIQQTGEILRKFLIDSQDLSAVNNFLYEATNHDEIHNILRGHAHLVSKSTLSKCRTLMRKRDPLVRTFGVDESAAILFALLTTKRIPDELWLQILENHKIKFEKKLEYFKDKILPVLQRDFQNVIETAIQQNNLPISKELLDRRIEQTEVTLKDAIHARMEELGGQYLSETDMIFIDSTLIQIFKENHLEHTYFHEMFHALSGRVMIKQTREIEYPGGKDTHEEIDHQRIGLKFVTKGNERTLVRFRWLNEAITELLTQTYSKEPADEKERFETYTEEKKLLELLITGGKKTLNQKLFIDAYFENLDPTLEPEKRLPAWKALTEQITEAWGRGFLNHVDESVKRIGVSETIEAIKKGELTTLN